jgi:ABC-2 type transport system permease protein
MRALTTLMKREWWEYRSAFLYIPMILTIILVFLAVIGLAAIAIFSVNITELPAHWQAQFQSGSIPVLFYGLGVIFVLILWLTVLSYFWTCLYNDRKDGSILFWQSMPVSQTQMLTAKVLMGILIVPLVWWMWLVICEFLLLILIGLGMKVMGMHALPIVWQPGVILFSWLSMLLVMLIQGLWLFPIIGWLVLSSAYAKRAPLLVAVVPPVVIMVIEYFIWAHSYVFQFIRLCFMNLFQTWRYFFGVVNQYAGNTSSLLFDVQQPTWSSLNYTADILFGILLGIIFLIVAGLLRNRWY